MEIILSVKDELHCYFLISSAKCVPRNKCAVDFLVCFKYKCNIVKIFLTSLARSVQRNTRPRSFSTNLALRARSVQKDIGQIIYCTDLVLGQ